MTEPNIREPYWLTKQARNDLAETIIETKRNSPHLDTIKYLDDVLTELGVVEARNYVWPEKTDIARKAQGHSKGTLPIRLNNNELDAILNLPTLSSYAYQQLT